MKQKLPKEKITNHQKAAKTRRQRGDQWEDTIVKRFKKSENWKAFRLGSPSIALPDVLAVNTQESTIFAIEAKSGTSTSLPVPADQIQRVWIGLKHLIFMKKTSIACIQISLKKTH